MSAPRGTIITGAASGMGEATARLLVARGERVLIADIEDERGEQIADELGSLALYRHADLTKEADVASLVDFAVDEWGELLGMVNNAGIIGTLGPIDTIPVDEWDATVAMLLRSVFLCIKHGARVMKPRRRGAIVNTTSIAALRGDIGPHAYAAAKAGVLSLTRNTAAELGSFGIRVNAVAPGRTVTPMVADTWGGDHSDLEGVKAKLLAETPIADRIGTADDIAEAYIWLLSDAAGYISGQVLAVDGGLTAGSPPVSVAEEKLSRYRGATSFVRQAGKRGLPPG